MPLDFTLVALSEDERELLEALPYRVYDVARFSARPYDLEFTVDAEAGTKRVYLPVLTANTFATFTSRPVTVVVQLEPGVN